MILLERLNLWRSQEKISPEQYAALAAQAREEPFSVFLELNVLLYLGVIVFVAGLGWTIQTHFQRIGDWAIFAGLTGLLTGCLMYCFRYGRSYSASAVESPTLVFDYVLLLGSLAWSVELAYLESRFHLLSGQWDGYLLVSFFFFAALAYRFDNRFVLSLALSVLGSWFGLKMAHFYLDALGNLRIPALLYGAALMGAGSLLHGRGIKKHFLGAYLNFAANVIFVALLSGVFETHGFSLWHLALLAAIGLSISYGINARQFIFVAYGVVYGYIGLSSHVARYSTRFTATLLYFALSGAMVIAALIYLARRFGKET